MNYTPTFLVQTKLDSDSLKVAKTLGITPEEFCREAIKFYATNCVHTQMRDKMVRKAETDK